MLKFEFSEQMVAIIGQLIGKGPYELAAPIIAEMQKQIDAQQPEPEISQPKNQKAA